MNQEKIGKFIAQCRKEQKLTQKALGEKLGVSEKAVSNWENGHNMPDLSLFKPLCHILSISVNDLISGERIQKEDRSKQSEENMLNTIDYVNKKIATKEIFIGIILLFFGVLIAVTALVIFPSDSSWGSIYSVFGAIVSLIGVSRFTKRLSYLKRIVINYGYFLLFVALLIVIDYLSVVNLQQAPRFSLFKIYGEQVVYYDTLFYDVIRCNVNQTNETYKIMKNQNYDQANIDFYCQK